MWKWKIENGKIKENKKFKARHLRIYNIYKQIIFLLIFSIEKTNQKDMLVMVPNLLRLGCD